MLHTSRRYWVHMASDHEKSWNSSYTVPNHQSKNLNPDYSVCTSARCVHCDAPSCSMASPAVRAAGLHDSLPLCRAEHDCVTERQRAWHNDSKVIFLCITWLSRKLKVLISCFKMFFFPTSYHFLSCSLPKDLNH